MSDPRFVRWQRVGTAASGILPCKVARGKPPAVSGEPPLSEAPNTQTPSSREFQNLKPQPPKHIPGQTVRRSVVELGASLELGVWNLELVAWALSLLKN